MKDYKRLTDKAIAEMLRNTEGESWDSDNIEAQCYIRLTELEDKIESGEIDYVADRDKEIARLTSENASLRARLDKAVELPCIEPMTTWDWDANTGCGKAHFGKFWKVLYRDNDGEFIAYMGATKEEATAMLSELKGEKKNG